jgi:hypothetical protein
MTVTNLRSGVCVCVFVSSFPIPFPLIIGQGQREWPRCHSVSSTRCKQIDNDVSFEAHRSLTLSLALFSYNKVIQSTIVELACRCILRRQRPKERETLGHALATQKKEEEVKATNVRRTSASVSITSNEIENRKKS